MPIGLGVGRNSATAAAMRRGKPAAPNMFSVNLNCALPEKSERLFEEILAEKKGRAAGGGNKWQDRLCILTANKLILSKPGSEEALDVIPLREVVDVSHVANTRQSEGDVYRHAQEAIDHTNAFYVHTEEEGLCAGRNYCFRTGVDGQCQEWISRLTEATTRERKLAEAEQDGTGIQYLRTRCRKMYRSRASQVFFSLIIVAAFLVSVVSSEVQPDEGSDSHKMFALLQTSFTIAFALELCFNAFGSVSLHSFFRDKWNMFDTVIVVISVLAETLEGFPAFSMIRLVRVFRVVRVFRWMTSLRQILFALMSAILPVINSFLILLLVTCIYAILATELFKSESEEYFGSFSLSLFTMFQIATGDAWASIVGRSLRMEDGSLHMWAVLFLVSYVLIVGLVLINIVIAVLLDEFLSTVASEKELSRQEEQGKMRWQMGMVESPLEPLLESISSFFSNEDLSARIQYIFKLLDSDGNKSLSCEELNQGLRKLDFHPPIHLSADDFEVMTEAKRLCNADGELDAARFEVMMRAQLQQHVQMKAATALVSADSVSKSLLFVLKQMALTLEIMAPVQGEPQDKPATACACASSSSSSASSVSAKADSSPATDPPPTPAHAAAVAGDGAESSDAELEPPCSFYVGTQLRAHVKLPQGLGFGRRWKGFANNPEAGQTWSAPRKGGTAPVHQVSRRRKSLLGRRSRSFNLDAASKGPSHADTPPPHHHHHRHRHHEHHPAAANAETAAVGAASTFTRSSLALSESFCLAASPASKPTPSLPHSASAGSHPPAPVPAPHSKPQPPIPGLALNLNASEAAAARALREGAASLRAADPSSALQERLACEPAPPVSIVRAQAEARRQPALFPEGTAGAGSAVEGSARTDSQGPATGASEGGEAGRSSGGKARGAGEVAQSLGGSQRQGGQGGDSEGGGDASLRSPRPKPLPSLPSLPRSAGAGPQDAQHAAPGAQLPPWEEEGPASAAARGGGRGGGRGKRRAPTAELVLKTEDGAEEPWDGAGGGRGREEAAGGAAGTRERVGAAARIAMA